MLAGLPIIAVIVMLSLRVRALVAVIAAIVLALALSHWFPVDGAALREVTGSLAGVTIAVVFIMFGGIIMSEFLTVSGAQDLISDWLNRAAQGRNRAILLLGIGIAPLGESIIGFGVGVIISVPLLIRAGLSTTKAVSISLLGLIVATWGSLAPGLLIISGLVGIPPREVGVWGAVVNLPVQLILGITIALVGFGLRDTFRLLHELVITTVLMWLTLIAVNLWVLPALGGVIAAVVGIVSLVMFARIGGSRVPRLDRDTRRAFLPYSLVIFTLLLATLVASVWDLGNANGFLTNPALWLMVAAAATPLLLRIPLSSVMYCLRRGTRAWFTICAINVLFISFGGLITANGMSSTLAAGASQLGGAFLFLLPIVSYIGGYVTASGSATSALLTQGITQTAGSLGMNAAAMLGLQNAVTGSAIMLAPPRVMMAVGAARSQSPRDEDLPQVGRALRPLIIASALIVLVYTVIAPLLIPAI